MSLGVLSLVVILSVLASYPLLQFLSLGYLVEASARVARTGRLRDGVFGISAANRLASIALGITGTMLPLWLLASLRRSAWLLNGEAPGTRRLTVVAVVYAIFAAAHIGWAVLRGGRLRDFLWPAPLRLIRQLRAGGTWQQAADQLWETLASWRLWYYWKLGLQAFVGATLWLFVPITLMASAPRFEDQGFAALVALAGGLLLAVVVMYLPLLQLRVATTGRFWAQFEWREARRQFQHAPIASWLAILLTLALAIPLYLLKAELVPREAVWLPALVFVMFIWPARLAIGWAVGRAERQPTPRGYFACWPARLVLLPVTAIYALIVYFTQFTSWYGALSLYEQHAFLVPVPFGY